MESSWMNYYITRGESMRIPVAVTDKYGKGKAAAAEISVIRYGGTVW